MATSDDVIRRVRRSVFVAALVSPAMSATAGPAFVQLADISDSGPVTEISLQLACRVAFIDHFPLAKGDRLRINIEATSDCAGAAPTIAQTRQQMRPLGADGIGLAEIEYDGGQSRQVLTLVFDEVVTYEVEHGTTSNKLTVRLLPHRTEIPEKKVSRAGGTRVAPIAREQPALVINLASSRAPHEIPDALSLELGPDIEIFQTELTLAGVTWYRLRAGVFTNEANAAVAAEKLRQRYPDAWIDRAHRDEGRRSGEARPAATIPPPPSPTNARLASLGLDQIETLMTDAARSLTTGDYSRAVQLYTKVLQAPNHDRHAQAQELLAVAREKNGQTAHARAEYQRYLAAYPEGEASNRVRQRLAALLAVDRMAKGTPAPGSTRSGRAADDNSPWRFQSYVSQYYRRDVNQPDEQDEIVSQSALYSDINFDARRRGERFDFAARLSSGYRNDFLGEEEGSGNEWRLSYAYADFDDALTGLRARLGRQSRNSGGILGRFDGLNLAWSATERVIMNGVLGKPVNSATEGLDPSRTFYGTSVTVGEVLDNLELGAFLIQQDIDGINDRQAIGTEFRYFGENQSLWGLVDYDISYNELGSAYVQGSWRFASRFTVHGSLDRRHSPFLSTGNALIGQPVASIADLLEILSEEEIRRLSLDRSPLSTTYTIGVSHSLSPRFQVNADANQSTIEESPASGGVAAIPRSRYRYVGATLVAGSLLKEGDVTVFGLRYADSDTAEVLSVTLDTRYPIGRSWRANPRLRVDRRRNVSRDGYQHFFTPALRVQYRIGQRLRLEFEAGKRITRSNNEIVSADRESYFINIGYQAYF